MNDKIVEKYGRFILLAVFLFSAALSGCNWSGNKTTNFFAQQTIFENDTSVPVHLSIDSTLVGEIDINKSYVFSASQGVHTYSAISKYDKNTISGGTFSSGEYVVIKNQK